MIETKRNKDIKQGNGDILHLLILESPLCDQNSDEYEFLRWKLLETVVQNIEISKIYGNNWSDMAMHYHQGRWVATFKYLEQLHLP